MMIRHKLPRVTILAAVGMFLSILGCAEKTAEFFAPIVPPLGTISGTVLVDGQPIGFELTVTISGPDNRTATTSNGTFSEQVVDGTYTVSFTTPEAHECDETSQQLTVQPGQTVQVTFTCTRVIPTRDETASPWKVNYTPTSNTCGLTLQPFISDADFTVENGLIVVTFPDAPEGGEIVEQQFDPATGAWSGSSQRVPIGGGFEAKEVWSITWTRTVVDGVVTIAFSGQSVVPVFAEGNNSETPDCTVNYDIMGSITFDL